MVKIAEMPDIGAEGLTFQPQRVDYTAPETSGAIGGVQAGWPRWRLTMNLTNLTFEAADRWNAFYRSRRGAMRMFLGYDLSRPFPAAHGGGFGNMLTVGGQPFFGSAGSWSQSIDDEGNALLTLEDVPSGLRLVYGDYVGFKWDSADADAGDHDRRFLVSVVAGGQADAAGSITISVEPSVHDVVPVDAIAHLDSAMCLMKLMDDTRMGRRIISHVESGGIISAVQVTLP
jgi:hypothetical protein